MLSAVVTAFIIEVGSGIETKPNPVDVASALLAQLVQKGGEVPAKPDLVVSTVYATQARALLYTSLSSSLLAAFGTLLVKEWVVHLRHKASWIDTPREHCYVRELRFQGIVHWRFIALMEILSMLLQVSLLFFGVGLLRSIQPRETYLDSVIGAFLIVGAVFYMVTLLCGAIYPTCPFKTPLTEYLLRFGVFLFLKPAQIIIYLVYIFPGILRGPSSTQPSQELPTSPNLQTQQSSPRPSQPKPPRVHEEEKAVSGIFRTSNWKSMFSRMRDDRRLMDRHMIDEAKAGVYFWIIQREGGTIDVQAAERGLLKMNKTVTKNAIHLEGVVHDWHTRAVRRSSIDSVESLRVLGDVIFHSLSCGGPSSRLDFSPCYPSNMAEAIRTVWGSEHGLYLGEGNNGMGEPVLKRATAAAYISAELDAALDVNPWNAWMSPALQPDGSSPPQKDANTSNQTEPQCSDNPSPYLPSDLLRWLKERPTMESSTLVETFALIACVVVPYGHLRLQRYHIGRLGFVRRRLPWGEEFLKALEVLGSCTINPTYQPLLLGAIDVLRQHIDPNHSETSINPTNDLDSTKVLQRIKNIMMVFGDDTGIPQARTNIALAALQDPSIIKWALATVEARVDSPVIRVYLEFLDLLLGIHYLARPPKDGKLQHQETAIDMHLEVAVEQYPGALRKLKELMSPEHPLRHYGISILAKGRPLFFPDAQDDGENLYRALGEISNKLVEDKKCYNLVDIGEADTFVHWNSAQNRLQELHDRKQSPWLNIAMGGLLESVLKPASVVRKDL